MPETTLKRPFDPSEYLSSTAAALRSASEHGAWFILDLYAWLDPDCSLPSDNASLSVLSRLGDQWAESKERILDSFTDRGDGRIVNEGLLELRKRALAARDGARRGGRASQARQRKQRPETGQMPLLKAPEDGERKPGKAGALHGERDTGISA
jgi:uncharacterized protein YdaU (DUF1376 family)